MDDACHVEPVHKTAPAEEQKDKASAFLAVWGMGCPNCAIRVQNSLISLKGVVDAHVDHMAGMAWVVYNPDLVQIPALIEAVARSGNDGRHEYWAEPVAG